MTDKLLPCPFCGGTDISGEALGEGAPGEIFYITCDNPDCGADGPVSFDREEAVKAWNTRAAITKAKGGD